MVSSKVGRDSVKIAVIGGGPKAAAIASKAYCLNANKHARISVSIFERHAIGAHWDGRHGYTDGKQQLCTPAERDLGFPYSSERASDVDALMQREFSWAAYQVDQKVYRHWVNKGRPAPSHGEFASYLRYCVDKSKAKKRFGEVVGIHHVAKKWSVDYRTQSGTQRTVDGFDALVITGHGPQAERLPPFKHDRVFDGVDFWSRRSFVEHLLQEQREGTVVIAGGGGTAAAMAGWLTRRPGNNPIVILGDQASFVARIDNWFENQVFTEREIWKSLSPDARRKFTERLTRGAVWSNVLDEVSRSEHLTYRSGRATRITAKPGPAGEELLVSYKAGSDSRERSIGAWIVVNATGFNDMWFLPLLPEKYQKALGRRDQIQAAMNENLSVDVSGYPPVHIPMLSQLRSPGFVSLMALGEMATDILQPYSTLG